MRLTERFSPDVNDFLECVTFALNHGQRMMHILSLRYRDDPSTPELEPDFLLWLAVHADCNVDGWKFYLSGRYTDASSGPHDYEPFTDRVISPNEWLDLTIEVRDNGQNTVLSARNLSTGMTYSKSITSLIGTRSLPVEIAVQYRHNERSRTDFVDFRLTQNDCGSLTDAGDSSGSSLRIVPGTCDGSLKTGPDGEDWYVFGVGTAQNVVVSVSSPASGPLMEAYDTKDEKLVGFCSYDFLSCGWNSGGYPGDYRVRIFSTSWSGTYRFGLTINDPPPGGGSCGGSPCKKL